MTFLYFYFCIYNKVLQATHSWYKKDYKIIQFVDMCQSKAIKIAEIIKYAVRLVTLVESDPKDPFSIAVYRSVGEGATPFPGILHFTLNPYLIMKRGIGYHFEFFVWLDLGLNSLSRRVQFAHGPGDLGSILGQVIPKIKNGSWYLFA